MIGVEEGVVGRRGGDEGVKLFQVMLVEINQRICNCQRGESLNVDFLSRVQCMCMVWTLVWGEGDGEM